METNEILQVILSKLESMDKEILDTRQELRETRQELKETRQDLYETKIIVENIPRQITAVAEQHGDIIDKLDAIADYGETKGRVSTLENVVRSHTSDITDLKSKAV